MSLLSGVAALCWPAVLLHTETGKAKFGITENTMTTCVQSVPSQKISSNWCAYPILGLHAGLGSVYAMTSPERGTYVICHCTPLPCTSCHSGAAGLGNEAHPPVLLRGVKKSSAKRYAKPVMMPSSDSGAGSDAGQGQGLGSTSDEEDTFPPSYQPPLAGLMSKGTAQRHMLPHQGRQHYTPSSTC